VDLHENESADKNVTVSLDHDWLQQQEHVAKWVLYNYTSSSHFLQCCGSAGSRTFHFHFDADPYQDPDPVPTFAHAEKSDFKIFFFTAVPVYCILFHLPHDFLYFEIFWIKF
jgi:hypothetical protein